MSKMGVCTFSGIVAHSCSRSSVSTRRSSTVFSGTASPVGGAKLVDIAATVLARHQKAFAGSRPLRRYPGLHGFRRDGEYHATNPLVVRGLQKARNEALALSRPPDSGAPAYDTFKAHVYGRPASPPRSRRIVPSRSVTPVSLDEVEPVAAICRRFFASAMSVGALSPETHRTIATAMNRLGARSNSGEGGEEPDRFVRPADGAAAHPPARRRAVRPGRAEAVSGRSPDWDGSRTKQVASARFGVTPAYLRSADELQIKNRAGIETGRGRAAARDEGDPAHRATAPRAAGNATHLTAGAPRHLQHRRSGGAHIRPARVSSSREDQRQAGRFDRRWRHCDRCGEGRRRCHPDQRPRRRYRRLAARLDQTRRHAMGDSDCPRRIRR